MIDWSEDQLAMRDAVRNFVETEVVPRQEQLEHGDLPPYEIIRKFYTAFGLDTLAAERFERQMSASDAESGEATRSSVDTANDASMRVAAALIPLIEMSRCCPGLCTAMGVSANLASSVIIKRGTPEQKRRWGLPLVTFEKVGAWAITEPDSGSDAFGSMRSTALKDGDTYILNGSKTFITNAPHADITVFICKLDEGNAPSERKVLSFVLDRGMPGFVQSAPLRKMGLHSSPTGQLFLTDVRAGADRLIGESEDGPGRTKEKGKGSAMGAFTMERASVAAMALGIIEKCLELSIDYARQRVQFGRPIADFQLIQQKLALMEVARLNVQNLVFRYVELLGKRIPVGMGEASAMKLYSARAAVDVAMEAVQLFGGNGYMSEYHVEQLARDAKVLQIYAGTDEIQTIAVAKELIRRG